MGHFGDENIFKGRGDKRVVDIESDGQIRLEHLGGHFLYNNENICFLFVPYHSLVMIRKNHKIKTLRIKAVDLTLSRRAFKTQCKHKHFMAPTS